MTDMDICSVEWAADEIERLRALVARYEAALATIANGHDGSVCGIAEEALIRELGPDETSKMRWIALARLDAVVEAQMQK